MGISKLRSLKTTEYFLFAAGQIPAPGGSFRGDSRRNRTDWVDILIFSERSVKYYLIQK